MYLALIGDVVASRRTEDRARLQRRLGAGVAELNEELAAALAAPLRVVAGDEVQGLFSRPPALVDAVVRISDHLFPARIAFGAGWGGLTTDLASDVTMVDGPCFHRAREALEDGGRSGAWVRLRGGPDPLDEVASALFRLMGELRAGWAEKQALYSRDARGRLQKEVAERHGVSPSVISESLKAAHFDALLEGEAAARSLLGRLGTGAQGETGGGTGNSW